MVYKKPVMVKVKILADWRAVGRHQDVKAGDILEFGQAAAQDIVNRGHAVFLKTRRGRGKGGT